MFAHLYASLHHLASLRPLQPHLLQVPLNAARATSFPLSFSSLLEPSILDISSIKDESLGGRRHWAMLVDEVTRCKHSS